MMAQNSAYLKLYSKAGFRSFSVISVASPLKQKPITAWKPLMCLHKTTRQDWWQYVKQQKHHHFMVTKILVLQCYKVLPPLYGHQGSGITVLWSTTVTLRSPWFWYHGVMKYYRHFTVTKILVSRCYEVLLSLYGHQDSGIMVLRSTTITLRSPRSYYCGLIIITISFWSPLS